MRFIGAVHIGIDRLRRHPRDAFGVLAAAVIYQISVVAAVYCAVQALDISIPNAAVIAFIPAVAMGQTVPLSVSGFGVREGLLVLLLHPLGVSTSSAVALGLFWYGMLLIVSLIGAPAFAMGQRAVRSATGSGGDTNTT
jgi:glycosyltransferase 2 family protein